MSLASSNSHPHLGARVATLLLHLLLCATALLYLAPFLWLVCAAFKQPRDIFDHAFLPWGHPREVTLHNFAVLFDEQPFGRWMVNSLFTASAQTVLTVLFSGMAGFALAKYEFRGKRFVEWLMLLTLLLPGIVLLTGYVDLMVRLNWIDTYKAMILPGAVSVFGTFLIRQAMLGVPDELLQAARIDGCGELRLWWTVAMPMTRPTVGAFTLMSFVACWNSYLWPSTVVQDASKFTLPMGLAAMMGLPQYESQYGVLMAGALLGMIPVAILFFALQRDFIAGIGAGAIKG